MANQQRLDLLQQGVYAMNGTPVMLGSILTSFFHDHLKLQKGLRPNSITSYADAMRAFQRLGNLVRGEEDLRYYKAVSLYETGRYDDARKELACALPYIPLTDDVTRYRTKIEQGGQRAAK